VRTAVSLGSARSLDLEFDEESTLDPSTSYLLLRVKPHVPLGLGLIASAVVQDEMRRKLRAVVQAIGGAAPAGAAELQDVLYAVGGSIASGRPILTVVDQVAKPGEDESAEIANLRFDFAAYAYYCATLHEVFTDQLDTERMLAATSESAGPGTFDALARARNAFTLDSQLAWRLTTDFRRAWSLETREPVR
jgi:hypothetical protein